ncbi:hypothetical protein AAFF_G00035470 [Aldrovandia affinis]|uniref:Uncharacterized protein n=1 Tax=Aldrovandia affinis TaxID=143900 RepID=A0AAD7S5D8_9TELE|nr:hypothetical protein AAFF_G00035470 [Aldrovandia affinis]
MRKHSNHALSSANIANRLQRNRLWTSFLTAVDRTASITSVAVGVRSVSTRIDCGKGTRSLSVGLRWLEEEITLPGSPVLTEIIRSSRQVIGICDSFSKSLAHGGSPVQSAQPAVYGTSKQSVLSPPSSRMKTVRRYLGRTFEPE